MSKPIIETVSKKEKQKRSERGARLVSAMHQQALSRWTGRETYNEGMGYGRQNGIFIHDVVDLFQTDDFGFLEDFDRIELVGLFIASQAHSSKWPWNMSAAYLSQGFALCHSHPDWSSGSSVLIFIKIYLSSSQHIAYCWDLSYVVLCAVLIKLALLHYDEVVLSLLLPLSQPLSSAAIRIPVVGVLHCNVNHVLLPHLQKFLKMNMCLV